MKNILISLAALMLAYIPAQTFAQQAGKIEINQISPAVITTPDIQFSGGSKKRSPDLKWVEVEVDFAAEAEFTEELTVKYYIAVAKTLLVGEVSHINVPQGRNLFSVMYVPPRTLERLLQGKTLTNAAFDNIAIQILVKGQLVAQKSLKGNSADQWFMSVQQVPGLLLNKDQTPFAPLYWDRYEMIKPAR